MNNRTRTTVAALAVAMLASLAAPVIDAAPPQQPVATPQVPRIPPANPATPPQDTLAQLSSEELHRLANAEPVPKDGLTPQQRTQALESELKRLGDQVNRGDKLHGDALKRYEAEVQQARRQFPDGSPEQRRALQNATDKYTKTSQQLEQRYRQPAQKKLIDLANKSHASEMRQALKNAGVDAGGASPAEQINDLKTKATRGKTPAERAAARKTLQRVEQELNTIQETAGTKSGSSGHRGWEGDTDAGTSARRANRVEKIANKMGLSTEGKPGYSNVKGMDLTTHKQGRMGTPGSSAHEVQIQVDAASKETYVSSGMKKGQVGRRQVEVQDHTKKALPGLKKQPADLFKSPGELQSMAKGTLKAIDAANVSDKKLAQIMRKNNIKGTPDQFRKLLKNLKGNGSHAPDAFAKNLNPKTMKNLQGACSDALDAANKSTFKQAKAQIARGERQVKTLETKAKAADAAGNKDLAAKLRKNAQAKRAELIDSKTRISQTKNVNRTTRTGGKPPEAGPAPGSGKPAAPPGRGKLKVDLKGGGGGKPPPGGAGGSKPPRPPKGPSAGTVKPKPVGPPKPRPPVVKAPPPAPKPGIMRRPISKVVGPRATRGFNGAMTLISLYGLYHGLKEGINDAIADSDARNEGDIKRGLRGGAYALWYGLGFKSGVDVGREEGDTFMTGYHAELYLNKIPPNSWEARKLLVKNKALAVGAALTRITQLDAAYEMGEEGVGLIGDLWGWFKSWRAEKEMEERLAAKRRAYVTSRHQQRDWYCTNRPSIEAPVALPPIVRKLGAKLGTEVGR